MRMSRKLLYLGPLVVLAVLGTAFAASNGETPARASKPSPQTLDKLQNRIDHDLDHLARLGVYVAGTGLSDGCVSLKVVNPTMPNVAYLRRSYGRAICVETFTAPDAKCAIVRQDVPGGSRVKVPDVADLGLYEAERHITSAQLSYTIDCPGDSRTKPLRPSRFSPDALVRITAQCPRAGEMVPRGTEVALEGWADLPGGFRWARSAWSTIGRPTCVDGRPPQ
jgi:hypothetical protein